MSSITGVIQGTSPRRGKGPGFVKVVNPETGEVLELSSFDAHLVRMAAANQGKEATVSWEEKESKKEPGKFHKNLTDLVVTAPSVEAGEAPESGSETQTNTPIAGEVLPVPTKRPPARLVDLSPIQELEQRFALAVRQRELLKGYVQSQFKQEIHYFKAKTFGGAADGKDVLAQPGAQLILLSHGYRTIPKVLSGPMEAPKDPYTAYTIVIECEVFNSQGDKVGSCIGSASSLIWSGKYQSYVPRAVDGDKTHNSTMKMAEKRAMVGACIQTTAASEFFTQDLEEGGFSDEEKDQVFRKGSGGFIKR